jgi:hypothetical protein
MLNFGNQFPFRILFRILSVIVVNCNLIISVMAAWPIKYTEWFKSGKKHPLPIDLSALSLLINFFCVSWIRNRFFFVIHWSIILLVTQIDFLHMTTVCGTGKPYVIAGKSMKHKKNWSKVIKQGFHIVMAKFPIPENCSAHVPMILKEFCSS